VLAQAGALIHQGNVTGERYAPGTQKEVDTETF